MSKIAISPSSYWPAVFFGYMALFTFGLFDNFRGPFYLDITESLQLSDSVASLFFVITSGVAFVLGAVSAKIFRRFGLIQSLRISLAIMGLGFIWMSYSSSASLLFFGCAIYGIGYGLTNVAQNLVVMKGSSALIRRKLLSGLHGVYALAALIAPILAEQFFKWDLNWQVGFRYISCLSFVGISYSYFVRWPDSYTIKLGVDKGQVGAFKGFQNLMKDGFIVVASMLAFYVLTEIIVSTRLSLLLRREYSYSPEHAARALTIFFVLLFLGRALFLVKHFRYSNAQIIGFCLSTSIVFFVCGSLVNPLFLVLTGLSMGPIFGLAVDLVAEKYPSRASEAVSFAVTASGILLVPAHYVVGFITQVYGVRWAVSLAVFPLLISLFCVYKLSRLKAKICAVS